MKSEQKPLAAIDETPTAPDATTAASASQDMSAIAKQAVLDAVEVNEHMHKMLVTAKIDLTRAFPFMGFLVMSTRYLWTDMIPTMAATTMPTATVMLNPVFLVKGLTNRKQRTFALAHEILHIFLEHIGRQRDHNYQPKLWNIATDFCINGYLDEIESGISNANKVMELPTWVLYDKKYYGMSSDAIYHQILEENDNDMEQALAQFGQVGDDGDGDGKQRPMDDVSTEKVSEASASENRQKVAAAVQNASGEDRRQGTGRGDLVRLFEDMLQPVIPWTSLLQEFVTSNARQRHTYNRISRRSGEVVFPTMTGDHVSVAIGIDTSGSMSSKDLGEAMEEVKSIVDTFESWDLQLISCDTHAHSIGQYSSEAGDSFGTIDKDLIGGGGTDMSPIVEFGNEMEDEPACLIIITDGYIPKVNNVEDIPVLLIVTKDGNGSLEDVDCTVIKMNDY